MPKRISVADATPIHVVNLTMDSPMAEEVERTSSRKLANRLIEAHERRYWSPEAATLEAFRRAGEELEDRLEGIVPEKVAA